MPQTKRKRNQSSNKILASYELANAALEYQNIKIELKEYRRHKKLQAKIHYSNGWKAYCV